jgi:hypothetical protein
MIQTTLFPVEKKILKELQHYNYCNSGVICDVALADKIKKINEVENGFR